MTTEGLSLRAAVTAVVLVVVLAISSCATSQADGKVVVVEPREAVRLLASEAYVVLDLRPASAFEAGHVQGALNFPYVDSAAFEATVGGLDPADRYFVYSRRAEDADHAADQLASLGFEHVVDGGSFGMLALAGVEIE